MGIGGTQQAETEAEVDEEAEAVAEAEASLRENASLSGTEGEKPTSAKNHTLFAIQHPPQSCCLTHPISYTHGSS